MKLLVVTPEFPPFFGGGIATFYGYLLPELVSAGMDVTVVIDNHSREVPAQYVYKGVKAILLDRRLSESLLGSFSAFCLSTDIVRHLAAAWAVWKQVKHGQDFDIVECADWGLYYVPWLLTRSNPPLIVRLHASNGQIAKHDPQSCSPLSGGLSQLIEAALLPLANSLVTYSQANRRFWEQALGCDVSYCPPPLPVSNIADMWFPSSDHAIVFGRLQEWKGVRTLCKALESMGSKSPIVDWYGRVISPQQSTGVSFDAQLKIDFPKVWDNKFVLHPPLEPRAVAKLQRSASFAIVPSDWDVFNYTVAESMASAVPILCSSGAGASEIIQNGINGFVFEAGNASDLVDAIERMMALSFSEKKSMGMKAMENILINLDPSLVAKRTIECYLSARSARKQNCSIDSLLSSALSPAASADSDLAIDRCLNLIDFKALLRHASKRVTNKFFHRFIK